MSLENLIFVILVALTLYNNGVQAYIHFEAYPLFAFAGKDGFPTYISEYEKRLTIPLLAPYGLTLLANLILIFFRNDGLPLIGIIILLVLNISVAVVTMVVATPVYNRIKASGLDEMPRLLSINILRLLLSTVSSLGVLYLLLTLLPVSP
jgi:hypothetical protein